MRPTQARRGLLLAGHGSRSQHHEERGRYQRRPCLCSSGAASQQWSARYLKQWRRARANCRRAAVGHLDLHQIRARVPASSNRFVDVLNKGIIMVPPAARSSGPWLDATRTTSLQRVANRPIFCHVLDALTDAEVSEIAVLTPPGLLQEITDCAERDEPSHPNVSYLPYDGQTDPAGALEAIAGFAADAPTILHRSDGLLGQPLAPFVELLSQDSTDIVMLLAQGARNVERLGPAAQRMLRVAEFDRANTSLGMAGVCVLAPGALGHLQNGRRFSRELELGVLADSLIALEGSRPQVRVVRNWCAFAGDTRDLLAMNRAALDALDALDVQTSAPQSEDNRFEGPVFIHATASVTSSVICGPVIVGAGAHVTDSYIGPHTSIGERVNMEGVEIERSIVFAGASILHVGGRLVASVVGRDARVFRDFSVPRAMRLQVGDGDEIALC